MDLYGLLSMIKFIQGSHDSALASKKSKWQATRISWINKASPCCTVSHVIHHIPWFARLSLEVFHRAEANLYKWKYFGRRIASIMALPLGSTELAAAQGHPQLSPPMLSSPPRVMPSLEDKETWESLLKIRCTVYSVQPRLYQTKRIQML